MQASTACQKQASRPHPLAAGHAFGAPQKERYEEIANEMRHMLVRVGWKDDFVKASVPIVPISGWIGDNLIKKSTNMPWWEGQKVKSMTGDDVNVVTLLDVLNDFAGIPERKTDAALRVPISGVYKIKGERSEACLLACILSLE